MEDPAKQGGCLKPDRGFEVNDCRTMDEVRERIDRIDEMIIALLADRVRLIETAAHLKTARADVRDEARIAQVLEKVRGHAARLGVPEELADMLYRRVVAWCVEYEFRCFDRLCAERRD
ncbi:MAG: chorismate mutase [Alphaproteobacteria bacterium]|nr:MAG: chorismate mutase [Alphaproteobacteria bacterium]